MTSIIYKTKDRYALGWSDFRGMFGSDGERLSINNLNKPVTKEVLEMTTEQLRCAWTICFGSDWVLFKDIYEHEDKFYVDVAAVLNERRQLASQKKMDAFYPLYKLIPETDENR